MSNAWRASSAPSPSLERALRVKSVLFCAVGIAALFAFPPSLDEIGGRLYVIMWIAVLIVGALLALIGSFVSPRLEAVGVSLESLTLASYAAAFFMQVIFSDRPQLFLVLALASLVWIVIPVWRAGDLWIYLHARRRLRREGLI